MDLYSVVIFAVGALVCIKAWKTLANKRKEKKLKEWATRSVTNDGKVILHGMYGNSDFLPTPSPFVLKLETYLRYGNIPYEIDKTDIWGEKGKTPWISFSGKNFSDSHFIIEILSREFGTRNPKYSLEENSVGRMARIMVEEHLYWAGVMWRFAFGGKDSFQQVINGDKTLSQWLVFICIAPTMKSMAWSQGMGRHSESDVIKLMLQDLWSLSAILGEKKFILGDEPCEDDCAVFAGLASAVFHPNAPKEVRDELRGKLKNLEDYCIRMKENFWPDWEKAIEKSKSV